MLKDYDCTILYHPGKANVVVDALSRKSMGSLAHIAPIRRPLVEDLHRLEQGGVQLKIDRSGVLLAHIQSQTSLLELIKTSQDKDAKLLMIKEEVRTGRHTEFELDAEGVLRCSTRICVPDIGDLRRVILEEAHNSMYTVHSSSTKMY